MEKTFTINELLESINKFKEQEDLQDYSINQILKDIEEEEFDGDIIDTEKITLIQCVGLLSYHGTYLRILALKHLLRQTHYSVSDFAKLNNIDLDFGEVVILSKYCKKLTDIEEKTIQTKVNPKGKEVRMYEINILKKAFKIK